MLTLRELLAELGGRTVALALLSFAAYLVGAVLLIPVEGMRLTEWLPASWQPRSHVDADSSYRSFLKELSKKLKGANSQLSDHVEWTDSNEPSAIQLRTNLLVANQELYGEYDRLVSEGSFRLNVAIHLVPIAVFLTLTETPWYLSVLGPLALLAWQGGRRVMNADDVLHRAVVTGVIAHPLGDIARSAVSRASDESQQARGLAVRYAVYDLQMYIKEKHRGINRIDYAVTFINNNPNSALWIETFDTVVRLVHSDGRPANKQALPRDLLRGNNISLQPESEETRRNEFGAQVDFDDDGEALHPMVDVAADFRDSAGRRWFRDYDGSIRTAQSPILARN